MVDVIIPTPPVGNYRWLLIQEFDGVLYRLLFEWNLRSGAYYVSFGDNNNNAQVRNIKMNLGADKLSAYRYQTVPQGILSVVDATETGTEPTLDSFGKTVNLVYTPFVPPPDPEITFAPVGPS